MSDEDPPDDFPSEPPSKDSKDPTRESTRDRVRSRLESVIPDLLKRAVELGVEKARESPDNLKQFVHDLKVPKELAHYLFQQVDDTKNGLFRVVAKEMRDFLEHTNFAGEVQKLLTTVQFEVNTTIRFTPNDGREREHDPGQKTDEDEPGDGGGDDERDDDGSKDRVERARDPSKRDSERPEEGGGGGHSLPKPEVKTSVRVHRDGASSDKRDGRGDRSARRRGP